MRYVEYDEEGEWEATETELPIILAICDTPHLQKRLNKQLIKLMDESGGDIQCYSTTRAQLAATTDGTIWKEPEEEELASLTSMHQTED